MNQIESTTSKRHASIGMGIGLFFQSYYSDIAMKKILEKAKHQKYLRSGGIRDSWELNCFLN